MQSRTKERPFGRKLLDSAIDVSQSGQHTRCDRDRTWGQIGRFANSVGIHLLTLLSVPFECPTCDCVRIANLRDHFQETIAQANYQSERRSR